MVVVGNKDLFTYCPFFSTSLSFLVNIHLLLYSKDSTKITLFTGTKVYLVG